jgi:hypothetical protein
MEYEHYFFHKPFEAGKYINVTGEMIKDVSANGLCGPGILQILMDTIEGLGLKCSKTQSTSITRIWYSKTRSVLAAAAWNTKRGMEIVDFKLYPLYSL